MFLLLLKEQFSKNRSDSYHDAIKLDVPKIKGG